MTPSMQPPPTAAPSSEFGPPSGSMTPPQNVGANGTLPAPAQGDPGVSQDDMAIKNIVMGVRQLAMNHPQIVPEVQQIGDLMQRIQMKLVMSTPPQEPAVPPS